MTANSQLFDDRVINIRINIFGEKVNDWKHSTKYLLLQFAELFILLKQHVGREQKEWGQLLAEEVEEVEDSAVVETPDCGLFSSQMKATELFGSPNTLTSITSAEDSCAAPPPAPLRATSTCCWAWCSTGTTSLDLPLSAASADTIWLDRKTIVLLIDFPKKKVFIETTLNSLET